MGDFNLDWTKYDNKQDQWRGKIFNFFKSKMILETYNIFNFNNSNVNDYVPSSW